MPTLICYPPFILMGRRGPLDYHPGTAEWTAWMPTLPFLRTAGLGEAARPTVLMGAVAGVCHWRARTEERHLMADPDYVACHAQVGRNAPVPRFLARAARG